MIKSAGRGCRSVAKASLVCHAAPARMALRVENVRKHFGRLSLDAAVIGVGLEQRLVAEALGLILERFGEDVDRFDLALCAHERHAAPALADLKVPGWGPLPRVKLDKAYVFDGPDGEMTLSDLFAGRSQLFIKHVMMRPGATDQCIGCSLSVDHFEGLLGHLENQGGVVALTGVLARDPGKHRIRVNCLCRAQ